MFYIFNNNNECVASCSFEPNLEDLESRSEICVESESIANLGDIYADGNIITGKKIEQVVDYESKARGIRDALRCQLDNYLKPASTISDELVTQEQKDILINDSLLLARWPATTDWPYIPLPELSELANTLLDNPVWTYPMEEFIDGN